MTHSAFARYIGIDYSGAQTPIANLKAYVSPSPNAAHRRPNPRQQVLRKWRSRKGIAERLVQRLFEDVPTLVGIDHAFSFSNAPCPALLPIP